MTGMVQPAPHGLGVNVGEGNRDDVRVLVLEDALLDEAMDGNVLREEELIGTLEIETEGADKDESAVEEIKVEFAPKELKEDTKLLRTRSINAKSLL